MLQFYRKLQQTKPANSTVCIPDLVTVKYCGNNNIEIQGIVFTNPDPCHPVLRHNSSTTNEYLPYHTHESVPTEQRERMVVGPGL